MSIAHNYILYGRLLLLFWIDHPFDHEIFVMVRGHDTPVVARQLDGRIDDVQGPVYDNNI